MTIVRPQYFYPAGEHVDDITLADFVVTKAATQWAKGWGIDNCAIHDCGQTGIVGNPGCVFSVFKNNHFHHCTRSIRLDWQAHGTRVTSNLFHDNCMAKDYLLKYDSTRYTPIHIPHRTEITGFMSILHGDVRFYNNGFIQPRVRKPLLEFEELYKSDEWDDYNLTAGTILFNGYMTEKCWLKEFEGYCGEGASDTRDKYYMPLPVYTGGNVFFNGAKPCDIEENYILLKHLVWHLNRIVLLIYPERRRIYYGNY